MPGSFQVPSLGASCVVVSTWRWRVKDASAYVFHVGQTSQVSEVWFSMCGFRFAASLFTYSKSCSEHSSSVFTTSHVSPTPYLSHELCDNEKTFVKDDAQQSHQVLMLQLPGRVRVHIKRTYWGSYRTLNFPCSRRETCRCGDTHVMTVVSCRKAWAVTSHLMVFTATLWPMYCPSYTAEGESEHSLIN